MSSNCTSPRKWSQPRTRPLTVSAKWREQAPQSANVCIVLHARRICLLLATTLATEIENKSRKPPHCIHFEHRRTRIVPRSKGKNFTIIVYGVADRDGVCHYLVQFGRTDCKSLLVAAAMAQERPSPKGASIGMTARHDESAIDPNASTKLAAEPCTSETTP